MKSAEILPDELLALSVRTNYSRTLQVCRRSLELQQSHDWDFFCPYYFSSASVTTKACEWVIIPLMCAAAQEDCKMIQTKKFLIRTFTDALSQEILTWDHMTNNSKEEKKSNVEKEVQKQCVATLARSPMCSSIQEGTWACQN
jgi:hypothetical protein